MVLKGKRTLIFAAGAAIPALVDVLHQIVNVIVSTPELGAVIPPKYYPLYALAVAIGTAVLRIYTSTPVGEDE